MAFAESLERGLQIGSRIRGQRDLATDRRTQLLEARDARLAKLQVETDSKNALTKIGEQEKQKVVSRNQSLTTLQSFADLARLPKSVRGPQVDAFVQEYQQKFQISLAPNIVDLLKKGSTEEVLPLIKNMMNKFTSIESLNMDSLNNTLSNPRAAAQEIVGLNNENLSIGEGQSKLAEAPTNEQKAKREIKRLEGLRDQFLKHSRDHSGTLASKTSAKQADGIQDRIDQIKKEASPTAQLIGDFKRGRISKQQLMNALAKTGRVGRKGRFEEGISATDINSLGKTTAKIFDSIFDPISGGFSIKNKKQRLQAAAIHERAATIFVEGRGKISIPAAVNKAARELRVPIPSVRKSTKSVIGATRPSVKRADPSIQNQINKAKEEGKDIGAMKKVLKDKGIDPSIYRF